MSNPPSYCRRSIGKTECYWLNFAKISGWDNLPFSTEDRAAGIATLNLLPQSRSARQTLIPLIYHNASTVGLFPQLSVETQKFLRENTLRLVAGEMVNRQWLRSHLARFVENRISVILLKSAAFCGSLYTESAPRLGVDIDLLVRRLDFDRACALIERSMQPVVQSKDRMATYDTLFERMFVQHGGSGPTVEIHRALTNPHIFTIDEDRLWSASKQHPAYLSAEVRMLSPEDTLLHLAIHAFRDLDFCTHNLLDAHEVYCQWQPDPAALATRAIAWGAKKVLYYLLDNMRAIMETPIEPQVLTALSPSSISNGINKKILQSRVLEDSSDKSLQYRILQLISQVSLPDNPSQGIHFQIDYAKTRFGDLFASR